MKRETIRFTVGVILAACFVSGAFAQTAPATPPPPIAATPEFNKVWCQAWAFAVETERKQLSRWQQMHLAGREPESAIALLVGSIFPYILPTITGKQMLPDNTEVDCTVALPTEKKP